jgi:hypothetical protein
MISSPYTVARRGPVLAATALQLPRPALAPQLLPLRLPRPLPPTTTITTTYYYLLLPTLPTTTYYYLRLPVATTYYYYLLRPTYQFQLRTATY